MTTSSYSPANVKNIYSFFDKGLINQLSREHGFARRCDKKISGINFIVGFLLMALSGSNSYSAWATQISLLSKKWVSKQALQYRMGQGAVQMVQAVLANSLQFYYDRANKRGIFSQFKRVLLQDSTTIGMPPELVNYFPGNKSGGHQCAIARIQSVFDLIHNRFCLFGLFPYTANDQSASLLINQCIYKGDLIIRDLGFFVLEAFKKIMMAQAYFLSRLPHNVCIYNLNEGQVNILKTLRKKGRYDQWVVIGKENPIQVRLVGIKVPQHIASERIRKARHHSDKRFSYSKFYLSLLHYTLYITNVPNEVWSTTNVAEVYRCRWKIETVFKTWKSHFNIQKIIHRQCYNIDRVKCTIFMMLLFITLFYVKIYDVLIRQIRKKYKKIVSLLKLSKLVAENFAFVISVEKNILEDLILRFACYESRSDRCNLFQLQWSPYQKLT